MQVSICLSEREKTCQRWFQNSNPCWSKLSTPTEVVQRDKVRLSQLTYGFAPLELASRSPPPPPFTSKGATLYILYSFPIQRSYLRHSGASGLQIWHTLAWVLLAASSPGRDQGVFPRALSSHLDGPVNWTGPGPGEHKPPRCRANNLSPTLTIQKRKEQK